MPRCQKEASVSLTTVLLTGTILLLIGLTVIINAVDLANASKDSVNYELNLMRSRSCLEESLNKIKINYTFIGSVSITYSDGACTATVAADPGGNANKRRISVVSTIGNYTFTITKQADLSVSPYIVSNP